MGEKKSGSTKAECYSNRELSWLKFNGRVLEEAADESVPLKWMIRIIAGFLIIMAAGGVISRAAASMLVAQVGVV